MSSSTTVQSEQSNLTETFTSPTSSELEIVLDPLVTERIARLKLLRKLQEYERRCQSADVDDQYQLIKNGLLPFIASTARIEQLTESSMRTLLVLLNNYQEEENEEEENENDDYYQNCIEPYVSILLPVILRLIFTSRSLKVQEMALRVLCSMTFKECRYTTTISEALEKHSFLVHLTYLCQRPLRRASAAVSEQATILMGNILRYTCNCSAADYLTERVVQPKEGNMRQSSAKESVRKYHREATSSTSTDSFHHHHRCCCFCPLLCLIAVLLLLSLSGAMMGSW